MCFNQSHDHDRSMWCAYLAWFQIHPASASSVEREGGAAGMLL
jgi:hypothetical protein